MVNNKLVSGVTGYLKTNRNLFTTSKSMVKYFCLDAGTDAIGV